MAGWMRQALPGSAILGIETLNHTPGYPAPWRTWAPPSYIQKAPMTSHWLDESHRGARILVVSGGSRRKFPGTIPLNGADDA
ncbi:hypothetical protein HJFPF1_06983 [Paramyrothecium foliicola]|nr:hypothetical protein HJFPF1_06983 [Paramyrothecium foliicola]